MREGLFGGMGKRGATGHPGTGEHDEPTGLTEDDVVLYDAGAAIGAPMDTGVSRDSGTWVHGDVGGLLGRIEHGGSFGTGVYLGCATAALR